MSKSKIRQPGTSQPVAPTQKYKAARVTEYHKKDKAETNVIKRPNVAESGLLAWAVDKLSQKANQSAGSDKEMKEEKKA